LAYPLNLHIELCYWRINLLSQWENFCVLLWDTCQWTLSQSRRWITDNSWDTGRRSRRWQHGQRGRLTTGQSNSEAGSL